MNDDELLCPLLPDGFVTIVAYPGYAVSKDGVSYSSIYAILTRRNWKWLNLEDCDG